MNLKTLVVLCRWKRRIFLRACIEDFLKTPHGKLSVAGLILASPAIARKVYTGAGLGFTPDQMRGALLLAHISLTLACILFIPAAVGGTFVLDASSEPLDAHPFCLREIAAFRFLSSVYLGTTCFLVSVLYLFCWRPLVTVYSFGALVLHFILLCFFVFVLAVSAAAAVRRLYLAPHAKSRAALIRRVLVPLSLASLFALPVSFALPKHFPGLLESISREADRYASCLQVPLAAAGLWSEGEYRGAAGWIGALLSAVLICAFLLRRWTRHAPEEIILDPHGGTVRVFADAFARTAVCRPLRRAPLLRAFATKDVILPFLRSPIRYVRLHALLLATLNLFSLAGYSLDRSLPPSTLRNPVLAAGAVLAVAALLAMTHCLNSLGMEGSHIALLRPVLGPHRLFAVKAASNFLYCFIHSFLYALVTAAGCRILQACPLEPQLLLLPAIFGSVLFVSIGMSLAFLLPDMKRRSAVLKGASSAAKYIFVAASIWLSASYLAFFFWYLSGKFGLRSFLLCSGILAAIVLGCCSGLSVWSLRRLKAMEI